MVAATDGPLVDVALGAVHRVELQPVAPVLLADEEARAHPAADDVVVHGRQLAALQAGAQLVVGRRAREAGGEVRLARLDKLHRSTRLLRAVGRGEDLVVVLLAPEAAPDQVLVHVYFQVLGLLLEHLREVPGQGHPSERGALRSDIDMPLAVDLLHRGVERLHGRVADHVRGVLHLKNLVRLAEGLVDVALEHPGRAGRRVPRELLVLAQQVGTAEGGVGASVPPDLEGLGGLDRRGELLGQRHDPAGALARRVVDRDRPDEAGDLPRLPVIDAEHLGRVAGARNHQRPVDHARQEDVDAVLRLAGRLRGDVEGRDGSADDLVLAARLERHLLEVVRVGKLPVDLRLLQDLAVGDGAPRHPVGDTAVFGVAVCLVRPQEPRAGLNHRDAAGGSGTSQTVELGRHAAAVHRVRKAVDREVLDAFQRHVERDVVPLHLELFGDDLRERGSDMLPHLGLDDVDRGLAIGRDREPDRGGKRVHALGGPGRSHGAEPPGTEGDPEHHTRARGRRAHEELTPRQVLRGRAVRCRDLSGCVSHSSRPPS